MSETFEHQVAEALQSIRVTRPDSLAMVNLGEEIARQIAPRVAAAFKAGTDWASLRAALGLPADSRDGCEHDTAICADCRIRFMLAALRGEQP